MNTRRTFLAIALALFTFNFAVAQNPALTHDPAPDKQFPASMDAFQLPSHGSNLNALAYIAAGAGPHRTVLLLHGFPGNEKNLDLAQAIRRAGWNVLYIDYRGSWGTPGDFSFTHCIEDVASALAWLRNPANAARLRTDPAHIVVVGHSMGGFLTVYTGANDAQLDGIIAISAADMAGDDLFVGIPAEHREDTDFIRHAVATSLESEGMAPLAGTSGLKLADELLANQKQWAFTNLTTKLAARKFLAINADDGLAPPVEKLVASLQKINAPARAIHFPTDHPYSDHRIALIETVLDELALLEK